MKKRVYIILSAIILFTTIFWFYILHPLVPTLRVKGMIYKLELSITSAEKTKGLSGRESLLPGHGMLFLYDHKELYPFTMKGMKFPLDFIWLDGNIIRDITRNVTPETPLVLPSVPIDKILEINAGEADAVNLQVGDTVVFNK